jgi:hypothetical protein
MSFITNETQNNITPTNTNNIQSTLNMGFLSSILRGLSGPGHIRYSLSSSTRSIKPVAFKKYSKAI